MKEFMTAIDGLPMIIKAVIAIFVDVVWHIYRIIAALMENDITALIVAVVLCIIPITPLIDLVTILLNGNVWRYRSAK